MRREDVRAVLELYKLSHGKATDGLIHELFKLALRLKRLWGIGQMTDRQQRAFNRALILAGDTARAIGAKSVRFVATGKGCPCLRVQFLGNAVDLLATA